MKIKRIHSIRNVSHSSIRIFHISFLHLDSHFKINELTHTIIINKKKETLSGVRERERKRNGRRTRTKKEGERENTMTTHIDEFFLSPPNPKLDLSPPLFPLFFFSFSFSLSRSRVGFFFFFGL